LIDRFPAFINNISIKQVYPGENRWNHVATVKYGGLLPEIFASDNPQTLFTD
jgi:hypothetical protein